MKLIDGKGIAQGVVTQLKDKVTGMFRIPGLAIILVGNDPASHTYVRVKERTAEEIGVHFEKHFYPEHTREEVVLAKIDELNAREDIHGIVVQLPLPKHLSTERIINALAPEKDVDGFHPDNLQAFTEGRGVMTPSLVRGVIMLVESTGFAYRDRTACIIANSDVFVRPLEVALARRGVKVQSSLPPFTACGDVSRSADLVVIAVGKPGFLTAEMVKPGAVVIDVGFTRTDDHVHGDADAGSFETMDGWLTPVPGGVGPMSVAMLLANTIEACHRQTA